MKSNRMLYLVAGLFAAASLLITSCTGKTMGGSGSAGKTTPAPAGTVVAAVPTSSPSPTAPAVGPGGTPISTIVPIITLAPVETVPPLLTPTSMVRATLAPVDTATPLPPATSTPNPPPSATSSAPGVSSGGFVPGNNIRWYRSPFTATADQLPYTGTVEMLAEPGVLLDATAAYDHLSAATTPILIPEAGYAYVAVGALKFGDVQLAYEARNIYLVIFRGLPSDGNPNTDLNQVLDVSGYVPGTGLYSPITAGAYVSLNWFVQQVQESAKTPNCGAGCERVTVVLVDIATASYRIYTTSPANPRDWTAR